MTSSRPSSNSYNDDDDEEEDKRAEIVAIDDEEDEQEWMSDRNLIRRAAQSPGGEFLTGRNKSTLEKIHPAGTVEPGDEDFKEQNEGDFSKEEGGKKNSVYTEEEEELIRAMGGKSKSSREPGYLGDSTLKEISMDFSFPICYIADVLVTWGCPIPIDVNMRLGDLVTGEQAFALLEAIHTLDVAELHDRYSDDDLMTVANDYDIDLKDAFDFAVKKGWNLPFGVRTCLRNEQEDELIQALAEEEY